MFNIPVINASHNNPQVAYDFNINPNSISKYKETLLNLEKIKNKTKINKKEIYEFYYMRYLYQDRNWLFDDLNEMIKCIGGWDNMMNENFYDYSMKILTPKKINSIYKSFDNFIKSDYQSITVKDTKKF